VTVLIVIASVVGAFVCSCWLTGRVRSYALASQLLDIPNERSSHAVPTPRGGGTAIVLTMIGALLLLAPAGWVRWADAGAMAVAGGLVAAIGFADDRRHLPRRWRLLAHVVAAIITVAAVGGLPDLPVFNGLVHLGWAGQALAMLYVVWLINLTNFMDGIDGIAATETITVGLGGALLYVAAGTPGAPWVTPVLLAAATAGFLVWNWPPARIFMGDSGSGFLGVALAIVSLQATAFAAHLFWAWAILLGTFVVDATFTLTRRALRAAPVHEAHRTHAYQHAAVRYGHQAVTLTIATINILWLMPLAGGVAAGAVEPVTGILVAYMPLIGAAVWLGAGTPGRTALTTGGRCV
jgi:Fuc2NAc and GlcNAc transferase